MIVLVLTKMSINILLLPSLDIDYVYPDCTEADATDDQENAREENERSSIRSPMSYVVDKSNPEEEDSDDDEDHEVVHQRFDRPEDLDIKYPTNERQQNLSQEDYSNMRYARLLRGMRLTTNMHKNQEHHCCRAFSGVVSLFSKCCN